MAIDVGALGAQMFGAAFAVLRGKAPTMGNFVQGECAKLAQTLATIETERASGDISDEQAQILLQMQKTSMRSVLTAAQGLALLDAEAAINAALEVARTTVNTALSFALL
jgi:hypothetical protein